MSLHQTTTFVLAMTVLAAASVTPSLALPNNGAFNRSSEAFKLTFQDLCQDVANGADDIEHAGQESPIAPTKDKSAQDKRAAEQLREKGRSAGCKI